METFYHLMHTVEKKYLHCFSNHDFKLQLLSHYFIYLFLQGLISEELANSFNIPIFYPTASEVKEQVSSNKHLSIERFQEIYFPPMLSTPEHIQVAKAHIRAVLEGILCKYFGPKLVDELFDRYSEKLENFSKTPDFTRVEKLEYLFMLAKRNDDC